VRLRPDFSGLALILLLAAATPALPAGEAPNREQVDRAVEAVKADPNLASRRTVTRLVWDSSEETKPSKPSSFPRWLRWIGELFSWIAQTSQMLFWLLIAALVGVIVVFLVRLFASRSGLSRGKDFIAPTHVQDLDIRPESLPDDIGAAARQLWDRGDHRAALALLYRGLLSRLAHSWEVPIRDSSTEGDCLMLAARVIEPHRLDYATRLVRTWQRAIYGGLEVETAVIHELCAGFDAHLNRPEPTESPRRAAFASGSAT
jgi:hypothetical protein